MSDEPEPRAHDRGAAQVHAIALLSGAAALVYEIVWTRRLTFVFGATIRAVSAVLAAYMAGLAIGAVAIARRSERTRRPLRDYAAIEAAIALCGALVPSAIERMRSLDSWLYDGGAATGRLQLVRFALALVAVGAPAALMGATFPLLVRGMRAAGDHGRTASLYAFNACGALAGTFFAGFYAIGALGTRGTERVAIALNLAAAGAALWVDRARPIDANEPVEAAHRQTVAPLSPALVTATVALTGTASIASEVLWSRALAFRFSWLNNTTYTFPAMLGMVLVGITLGSLIASPIVRRTRRPAALYAALLALTGASIASSALVAITRGGAPFGAALDAAENLVVRRALANVLAEAAAVVLAPSLLFGALFTAAIRACDARSAAIARLYAASTAGAIAGSLGAAFVLVPRFGIMRSLIVLGALVSVGALVAAARARDGTHTFKWGWFLLSIVAIAFAHRRLPSRPQLTADNAPVVFYEEGPTATVTVARAADGYLRIDVDGVPVAGTSPTMLTDQKSLAHLPMMLVARPRRALTVGFGSGGTSHSLLLHAELEAVHAVEIAPEMLHGAPHLTASNHGVLARRDPRYRVVLDDARSYLAHTSNRYDIIATDCTDLRYRSNANLYDVEYFRFARERLQPGGVVAVWLPVGGLSRETFSIALRTFDAVFRDAAVFWPNGYPSHYVVLVGWRDGRAARWERVEQVLARREIRDDLREISLDDPSKIFSGWLADGASLRSAIASAPINTEEHPVLEFEAPLQGYARSATVDNLRFLWDHRSSAEAMGLADVPAGARARIERMQRAMDTLIAAHGASFAGQTHRAAELYLEALAIAPEDRAARERAVELARELRDRVDEPEVALTLCRAEQLTGDRERARACYDALSRARDESIAASAVRWRAELDRR